MRHVKLGPDQNALLRALDEDAHKFGWRDGARRYARNISEIADFRSALTLLDRNIFQRFRKKLAFVHLKRA